MEETSTKEIIPEETQEKDKDKKKKKEVKEEATYEKIELALYRAQMGMVRTATTMTTFGFALYKLLEEKVNDGKERPILKVISPKYVAITLLFAGFIGLSTYTVRHIKVLKKINRFNPSIYYSGVMLMSYIILLLTLTLFIGMLVNN